MNLNKHEIRNLRQRLGWTMAEMARRMGCTTVLIQAWENGSMLPDPEAMNQLHYLQFHVDKKSYQVGQTPLAEKEMESRGVAQLTHRDLSKDIQ